MVSVPGREHVIGDATLENKDIGFVVPAQDMTVRLETFPFTRYGAVKSMVNKVTQNAVTDEKRGTLFPALITLNHRFIDVNGRQIKLAPGMNLMTEIRTGKRRVIDCLMCPIQKVGSESLHER